MTNNELYKMLRQSFKDIIDDHRIREKIISFVVEGDPLPAGSELTLTAEYQGAIGECSTSFVESNESFIKTLSEIMELDIENNPRERSIYIAALNAVMNRYKLADDCVACTEGDKSKCAEDIVRHYKKSNGNVNVLLIGYHLHIHKALAANFPLRTLDLNPDNIGKTYFGVTIEHGKDDFADAVKWADVILCTGACISNGTLVDYINLPKDVMFYGTTIAGAARVLDLRRLCPYSRN